MGFLDTIRFGKRRSRPVGDKLETGFDDSPGDRRRNIAVKTGLILFLVAATMLAFPGEEFISDADVGEIWNSPTLVAPYAFSISKDPDQLAREREEARSQVAPLSQKLMQNSKPPCTGTLLLNSSTAFCKRMRVTH